MNILASFPNQIQLPSIDRVLHLDYALQSTELKFKLLASEFKLILPEIRRLSFHCLYGHVKSSLKFYGRKFFPSFTRELALKHGFKRLGKVAVRWQKTRWGSCSESGNVSLNAKLLLLPRYLLDYIILHELIHTENMSHDLKFKARMSELVPCFRTYDLELRRKAVEFCF